MIRFSKYLWLYALISGLVLVPGVFSLIRFGLRPSIDFTGGTLMEIQITNTNLTKEGVGDFFAKNGQAVGSIQTLDDALVVRLKPLEEGALTALTQSLNTQLSGRAKLQRVESVGPILGSELLTRSIVAAIFAVIGILFYVAYAFKNFTFGVSAILALAHDLLVVLGSFSLFGLWRGVEVDTLFVTAFLTTMSFSVHDTIVVFDRIREYMQRGTRGTFEEICDLALTETMGRSLTNSFTIIFMLLALVLLGGTSTYWFAVALLIGTISGTYSSPFVATPLLILWYRWQQKKKKS